jgi:hypothetical protein
MAQDWKMRNSEFGRSFQQEKERKRCETDLVYAKYDDNMPINIRILVNSPSLWEVDMHLVLGPQIRHCPLFNQVSKQIEAFCKTFFFFFSIRRKNTAVN